MTTIPNLNPIPAVTGDDYLITHDITTNRSGRVGVDALKTYVNSALSSDIISYSASNVGAQLDKSTRIIQTFAALSTTPGNIGDKVYILGHTVSGFGAGTFVAVSSSGFVANNGTVAINGSIAWLRYADGFVTPHMFGAYPGCTRSVNDAAFSDCLNSGFKTVFVPSGIYQLSAKIVIAAASLGITLFGEDLQNTILQWQIDTGTTNKFGLLLDAYVTISNLTIQNTGNDLTNSGGLVSYTPTDGNGFRNSRVRNVRLIGWHAGIGGSLDGTSLTMVRSMVFSNIFENVIFYGCGIPIKLGNSCNANVWIRPEFLETKGSRHIYMVEGSTNTFLTPQFEPVHSSVTTGFLNAELVISPNCSFINAYLEPCYGFVADSSPGTKIDNPLIEGFDFTIGTLSNNAILRSTDVSNAGVYSAPMVSSVSLPVSRATVNPTSYCASDDNSSTLTLVDGFTTRDANFKLKPPGQTSKLAINKQGTWTPSLIGSSAGGSGNSYSQRSGTYIRTGDLVTCWFRLLLSSKDGALVGNVLISGLPFKVANISQYAPSGNLSEWNVDLTTGYTVLQFESVANSNNLILVQSGDAVNPTSVDVSATSSSTILIGQLSYITDEA